MTTRVAYLGPKGTFAEHAAFSLAKLEKLFEPKFLPFSGMRAVIEQVVNKNCDAAVVPIENSVEGGVTATLDALWSNPDLFIQRALVLPIKHALISSGQLNEISEVLSHPQALAQCSGWLNKNLPNALHLPTSSTGEAVKMVEGSRFRAAIASRSGINLKSLSELAYPINDVEGNRTRFVLLQREEINKGGDIASFAFSLHSNSPGALLQALSCIAELGINLSRIESRPSKRELGEYIFFIDIELSNLSSNPSEIIQKSLLPLCENLVHFGSYSSNIIEKD